MERQSLLSHSGDGCRAAVEVETVEGQGTVDRQKHGEVPSVEAGSAPQASRRWASKNEREE